MTFMAPYDSTLEIKRSHMIPCSNSIFLSVVVKCPINLFFRVINATEISSVSI